MDKKSIGIVGGRDFNNYYLAYNFLKYIIPPISKIVSGGAKGADEIAKYYAELNDHEYVEYPADWDSQGKVAGMIRNQKIVDNSDEIVAFHDGKSHGTFSTITKAIKAGIPVKIILYNKSDIITPSANVVHYKNSPYNVYIGRSKFDNKWANPFPMETEDQRTEVIYKFTDYLIKEKGLLDSIDEIKDEILGCFCSPKACHGDVLVWISWYMDKWSYYPKIQYIKQPEDIYKVPQVFIYYHKKPEWYDQYEKDLGIDTGYKRVVKI